MENTPSVKWWNTGCQDEGFHIMVDVVSVQYLLNALTLVNMALFSLLRGPPARFGHERRFFSHAIGREVSSPVQYPSE